MSVTFPLQSVAKVLGWLRDACDEWLSEGHSLSGYWIVLPSGLSINLANISIPSMNPFSGIRFRIVDLTINIPKHWIDIIFPQWSFLWESTGSILNTPIPGSENWDFSGPLRGNQWPPKAGTLFDPVEYYRLWHLGLDASSIILIGSIIYALIRVGLSGLASKFVKKALTSNTIPDSDEINDIKADTDALVDTLLNQTQESWLAKGSQFAGIVGVINSIIANIWNVYLKWTLNESTDNIAEDVKNEVASLSTELQSNLSLVNKWLVYLDQYEQWLAHPIGNSRPIRPSLP
jgi:hypothetical protein